MTHRRAGIAHAFEALSTVVTRWAGSPWGFGLAGLVVIAWIASGPAFGFSDTWQLVINTGTTIVTFLMVFLIQRSQNKEAIAMQLKLNELIAAMKGASNRMVDIEGLDEEELLTLRRYYHHLSQMARADHRITQSHSIAEAEERHTWKGGGGGGRKQTASAPTS